MAKAKKPKPTNRKGSRNEKFAIRLPQPNLPESLQQGWNAIEGVRDFILKMGAQVEPALYSLICDRQHPMRSQIDRALVSGTQAAVIAIAPQLVSEYRFSLVAATSVAAFAAQQVAAKGQSALCAELSARRAQANNAPATGTTTSLFPEPVGEPVPSYGAEPEEKPVKNKPKPKPANKPKPKPTKPKPKPPKPKGGKKGK